MGQESLKHTSIVILSFEFDIFYSVNFFGRQESLCSSVKFLWSREKLLQLVLATFLHKNFNNIVTAGIFIIICDKIPGGSSAWLKGQCHEIFSGPIYRCLRGVSMSFNSLKNIEKYLQNPKHKCFSPSIMGPNEVEY